MKLNDTGAANSFTHYTIKGKRFSCDFGSYPSFCGGDILHNFRYPLVFDNKTADQWTRDVFCSLYELWDMDVYWNDKEDIDIDVADTTFGVFIVEIQHRLFYDADKYLYLPKESIIGPYINANSENAWKMMFVPMHPYYYNKWNQDRGT